MARAGLGWGVRDLASYANVAASTVQRIERDEDVRVSSFKAVKTALEAAGVEFTNGDAAGVRIRDR
jgi:transcriptional regulator with XRE-family HTH domain